MKNGNDDTTVFIEKILKKVKKAGMCQFFTMPLSDTIRELVSRIKSGELACRVVMIRQVVSAITPDDILDQPLEGGGKCHKFLIWDTNAHVVKEGKRKKEVTNG